MKLAQLVVFAREHTLTVVEPTKLAVIVIVFPLMVTLATDGLELLDKNKELAELLFALIEAVCPTFIVRLVWLSDIAEEVVVEVVIGQV